MEDKKVLYFEATKDGNPIVVQEPVVENVMGKVIDRPIGINDLPVTKYGVDYHIAFMEPLDFGETTPKVVFEGKQDDFFYFLEIESDLLEGNLDVDTESIKKLIDNGVGTFHLQWWQINDAYITDDPGISRVAGVLAYYIKLTNAITLQIVVENEKEGLDHMDDMAELCRHVNEGKYELCAL